MLRQEMFLMKVLCLIPGVQNLCSDCKCDLFCDVMWPVLLTSNDVTLVVMCDVCDVSCEMCILVGFVCVSLFYIVVQGNSEFKHVKGVLFLVPDCYVRFQIRDTDLRGHSAAPWCLVSLYVTEYCEL